MSDAYLQFVIKDTHRMMRELLWRGEIARRKTVIENPGEIITLHGWRPAAQEGGESEESVGL